MKSSFKATNVILLFLIIAIAMLFLHNYSGRGELSSLNYSKFRELVDQGAIKEVVISGKEIKGQYKVNGEQQRFTTIMPFEDEKLVEYLVSHKVGIKAELPADNSAWYVILINVLPFVLLFFFILWLMRQAGSGGNQAFSFGRSRAKQVTGNFSKITFNDVAGVEEAKEELKEVVDFLKNPQKYRNLGARIPKGVLLLGAPGTGKTLLGRAIAGEAEVPFFYISGSDFVEMFVGVGASRVRDLFTQAKRSTPCIIFVDEIDAVGRQRGTGLGGGHDEREQTLNQLLVEMDGFEPNLGVVILAATNRPDVLDPALLRPGRFDRQVVVDKPDIKGRTCILEVHARGKPLGEDVDLEILAKRTPGFTGAELEALLNEAALLAARQDCDKITMKHCEDAIDRVMIGPEKKSRIISDKEKEITAYHEAGHALVAKSLPEADPVRKVTIIPRGMALGTTWQMPEEDKHIRSKTELMADLTILMGGRCAELMTFSEFTTGASNDLKTASELARDMITRYGMSEKLGPLTFGRKHEQVFLGRDIVEDRNYSDETAKEIDFEVKALIDNCYQKAGNILTVNRELLEYLVQKLKEKEVLEGDELDRIFAEWENSKNQETNL